MLERIEAPHDDGWLTDQIVEFAQQSDFRIHADSDAFRADRSGSYMRLHIVSVYVTDQERSKHFFVDQLGFTLLTDARFASGNRWIEVSPPDGTGVLALVRPIPGLNEERLVGNSGMVTFLTDDVERVYQEWSARGVQFPIPPQTPAWGGTFCRFVDPDGNWFALAGFDSVTRALDARRRAYAERLEAERRAAQEIEIAKQVQARLFPQRRPEFPSLDYAGLCVQARSVGGDYYDFLDLGCCRLALVVGDIAGKGIAAALLMANLQGNLRSQYVDAAERPELFLSSVNRMLFDNSTANSYATLFFADYEPASGRLRYANCGHLAALVLRADGSIHRLDSTCTVVGLFDEWQCSLAESRLEPGDLLAIYTDGITEALNAAEEEFGEAALIEALQHHRMLPAEEMTKAIVDDVLAYSGGRQFDDITLIVARRTSLRA